MKSKIKDYLDLIPLIIIFVYAIFLIKSKVDSGIILVWQNYVGLIFLTGVVILFFIRHLFGVLALGLTLLLGFVGFLSYSPGVTTTSLSFGGGAIELNSLPFQPIFLLWIIIYFIVSWRHIVGIGTKKYWDEIKIKKR